jgi:hypothetical protein
LIMDYIEGVTAATLAHWASAENHQLPEQIVVDIVRQAAEGLGAAHRLTDSRRWAPTAAYVWSRRARTVSWTSA